MNELEVFRKLLRDGEYEKAIALSTPAFIRNHGQLCLLAAIQSGSISVFNHLISSGLHPYQSIYVEVVAFDQFPLLQWMLKNRIGNKNYGTGSHAALDYALSSGRPTIAHLMMEYGCDCEIEEHKNMQQMYFKRRTQLRTFCTRLIDSPIGHKDTNAIIARVVWSMRLFISK